MKRYFIFMAIIFGMIAPSASAQTVKKKVAVYMTGNDVQDSYKKVIGAKLVSTITATNEYAAVERTADFLDAISKEQDYQASGEVRVSQIVDIGEKFGVRYVVVADVSELFDEIFIASRLINVETGLVERSFEANAPAESMAQLIDISSKVAKGLLGTGGFTQSEGISTEPTNMSLCATQNGRIVFISPSQWIQMKETEKMTLNKKGICLIEKGNAWIISMEETSCKWDLAKDNHAASFYELSIILDNKGNINKALEMFGGTPMGIKAMGDTYEVESCYWTNEPYIKISYNKERLSAPTSYVYLHRPIYKLAELL